ncbi:hypothetical protein IVB33_30105 [Bradyrhizobium sp. 24]|uniref:hypothetical protein n=1 Tax=unclassified Bradyrhizobium TaxID=2631580 RepID=UPI001FFA2AD4|nr:MULTISPECIES: hypothetical protein [unclassified Bradyrhizobium]MCK1304103.1 hypothetical protein [Bradyrhizobium sp. 37]MCK1381153.1 hypothetical protein [Bradyrhizobium sp. 24]MCK1768553.1 hypothetical protein [Bradyrhizobium sp. 134]
MLRSFIIAPLAVVWACPSALSLTSEEIIAKLRAAGYSQIQELPAGKIKTYKAVKEGTTRSVIIDSTGHIAEVAR